MDFIVSALKRHNPTYAARCWLRAKNCVRNFLFGLNHIIFSYAPYTSPTSIAYTDYTCHELHISHINHVSCLV